MTDHASLATGRETNGNNGGQARPDIFQQLQWPSARIVDRILGLMDADVADIVGYC